MKYEVIHEIRKVAKPGDIIELPLHEAESFLGAGVIVPLGESKPEPIKEISDEEAQFAPLALKTRKEVDEKKKAGRPKKSK